MDYLQFGNDKVAAVTDTNGNYNLSVNYTSGWTLSSQPFVWKGIPLTSYTDGNGNFSLAVYIESGTPNGETYVYKGNRYGVTTNSSNQRVWSINSSGSDSTVYGSTIWRGQAFAYNAEKQLLLTQVTGLTFDQTDMIFVGGMPLKVGRVGSQWYLVASDAGTNAV